MRVGLRPRAATATARDLITEAAADVDDITLPIKKNGQLVPVQVPNPIAKTLICEVMKHTPPRPPQP